MCGRGCGVGGDGGMREEDDEYVREWTIYITIVSLSSLDLSLPPKGGGGR